MIGVLRSLMDAPRRVRFTVYFSAIVLLTAIASGLQLPINAGTQFWWPFALSVTTLAACSRFITPDHKITFTKRKPKPQPAPVSVPPGMSDHYAPESASRR